MSWSRPIRLGVMTSLALVSAAASAAGLISLNAGGAISAGPLALLPMAAGYDRRGAAETDPAQPSSPPQLEDARIRARAAIAEFPYDSGAWLRLAYIDRQTHGRLTADGLAALRRSYDLVAAEPDFGVWRVAFALENSQSLPQSLRAQVRQEVATLWTVGRDRQRLSKLPAQLQNPAGRLSLALWINLLQLSGAK